MRRLDVYIPRTTVLESMICPVTHGAFRQLRGLPLLHERSVTPHSMMPRWVPADWLTQWANGTDKTPFPKDALLCKDHGKLDPNKVTGTASPPADAKHQSALLLFPFCNWLVASIAGE